MAEAEPRRTQPGDVPLIDRAEGAPLFMLPSGQDAVRAVSAEAFLHDVLALAAALPPGRHLLNRCTDRYRFSVAFAAGLVAGRTSLMNLPPDAASAYPDRFVLDDAFAAPILATPPAAGRVAIPAIHPDHLAAIVFTSGSTGAATGHEKRWGALAARSRAAAVQFGTEGRPLAGTILGTVPPQHMYGFETTVLLPFHAPVASWCGPAFFPADIAAALGTVPFPRILVTTPLQLRALLAPGLPLAAETVVSATAPLDHALAAAAEDSLGARVLEIFGATECGSIASRRTLDGPSWFPYPGIALRMDDAGTAVTAPFMPPVPLQDMLEQGDGGTFRLLGRRTDLLKRAGRRASLQGLNRALLAVPGVSDGTFVAEREDARPVAVVVAPGRPGAEILATLRGTVDPAFLPRRVIHVDAMPRNAMGKLPRRALLALLDAAP